MGITDVLRGEDLLSSTPRQLALYTALTDVGLAQGAPRFGHLPLVMGEGNKKLSKRDPTSNLDLYRERGFLPEGLVNYLACWAGRSPRTATCSRPPRWSRPSTSAGSAPTRPAST